MATNEHLRMRHPVPSPGGGPRGGGLYVSELQRARLLDATFAVVTEQGYRGMAVRAVAERAGVSSKTFYDLFTDREDCFLAAFNHGVDVLAAFAAPAYARGRDWVACVREGLGATLSLLDDEPALRTLVFVEALGAGPRVLARRAEVLKGLAAVIDEGRVGMKAGQVLPRLTGEGIVGATFAVIHSRLLDSDPEPLTGLLNDLMATIVLPYRGAATAARQLAQPIARASSRSRPADQAGPPSTLASERVDPLSRRDPILEDSISGQARQASGARPLGSGPVVDFRMTVRTQTVLTVVAEHAGLNNQQVSERAGISDQGQISRLMMRLSEQGLVENTATRGQCTPKAWRLTPHGEELVSASRTAPEGASR